ncbi:Mismatch repair endonuclease PMS2 [Armadillidium vulgare]|nr:Mismatch repair endonuclease PMS2 [Armadillidium vulgare]
MNESAKIDLASDVVSNSEFCDDVKPTAAPAKSIKAIDKTAVHRICSGQVVLTLATAVKELVENSIDAGATSVEIKLVENGSSIIEVSDNGKGVEPCDFEGLTLSSLCALSNLTIITRHKNHEVGSKLIYNTNGHLTETIPVPRQVGTTVTLENLFYTLPVRHKEFLRNLKKEFNKMVQVLYSYCLISTNVRINCTNLSGKNKTTIVSTESQSSLKENISSIFGPKQVAGLLQIEQKKPTEEVLLEYGIHGNGEHENNQYFKLEGYISSCAHGNGRSASDRQFYFINNRPCDPSKVMRVVNDIYHRYNKHQFPMVVLNIKMQEEYVDINVTPDKRQILIGREKHLLATIKSTLINLYEKIPSTLDIRNFGITKTSSPKLKIEELANPSSPSSPNNPKKLSSLMQRFSRTPTSSPVNFDSPFSPSGGLKRPMSPLANIQANKKQMKLQDYSCRINGNSVNTETVSSDLLSSENQATEEGLDVSISEDFTPLEIDESESQNEIPQELLSSDNRDENNFVANHNLNNFLNTLKAKKKFFSESSTNNKQAEEKIDNHEIILIEDNTNKSPTSENYSLEVCAEVLKPKIIYDDNSKCCVKRLSEVKSKNILFSLDHVRKRLHNKKLSDSNKNELFRKFRAQISPTDNKTAEEELKREISKESFSLMEIIGQFNLGFMITRLHSDLFIIDQHATDEKYNFETLQKTCVMQNQKLIIPQALELTAANEGILLDNIEIFTKNGFSFQIDNSKSVGKRVMLLSLPYSKGWEFNKEDIEEMIFMLSDSPGVMCRPSRISAMFASRACRKSVMIGTHLSRSQMRKLIDHMSEIEQPWNCPHGRPTIRHLINLDVLTKL